MGGEPEETRTLAGSSGRPESERGARVRVSLPVVVGVREVAPRSMKEQHECLAFWAEDAWERGSVERQRVHRVQQPTVFSQASLDEVEGIICGADEAQVASERGHTVRDCGKECGAGGVREGCGGVLIDVVVQRAVLVLEWRTRWCKRRRATKSARNTPTWYFHEFSRMSLIQDVSSSRSVSSSLATLDRRMVSRTRSMPAAAQALPKWEQ